MSMNYVAVATSARAAALAAYDADKYDDAALDALEEARECAEYHAMGGREIDPIFDYEEYMFDKQLREIGARIDADPSNEELIELYSDLYKDFYGVRPRWRIGEWHAKAKGA